MTPPPVRSFSENSSVFEGTGFPNFKWIKQSEPMFCRKCYHHICLQFQFIFWPYLQNTIAIIMIVQIHPYWCRQWQYSGWNEAWKRLKRWSVAPATVLCANSWSMPIYYALPGWIIPAHHQAGLFFFTYIRGDRFPKKICLFFKFEGGAGNFRSKKLHCRFDWFQSGIFWT